MNRTLFAGALLTVCFIFTRSQTLPPFPSGQKFLKGYTETISGEMLSYWNFHPFAKQSLLTRCTTGEMAIEWKTQTLPATPATDTLSFLWIGAYNTGTATADHQFDLYVNGEKSLTFSTKKGGYYNNWVIPGAKGVLLYYKHVWIDHVNDAHGYFCLRVPANSYPAGQPLNLKVVGRKADSRDWYMTFRYAVKESAVVRPLPLLVRESGGRRQPIEISVDSPEDKGSVTIGVDGATPVVHPTTLGWNAVRVSVPAVARERSVPLSIAINAGPAMARTAVVKPVTHRTIWLLPHSHNDIGYSDVQTVVLEKQIQNIREALRLIDQSKNYPDGARFKWNIEILWPVDSFLVKASPHELESFLSAVRTGSIGLNALYVNPLTGITRPEALIHLTDFARELERSYTLRIPTAMVSDIPGFIWSTVPALAQSGIRYYTSGPNSGDRIGHFGIAWGDKPFWWVGPSKKDSVLFWVAGTGYSLFHATRTLATNDGFLQKLQEYLEQLDARKYPYDMVQMRYSVYSDNGMTDSTMPDVVKQWNERYESPTLRIATATEMFEAFETQYGASLPSFAGDITPYWEDGAASSAAELGMAQRAQERLVQAEIVTSMSAPRAYDAKAFADAWDAINLWNEHTWGAWNSVSDPDNPDAVAQWGIKQEFARTAEQRSLELMNRRIHPPGAVDTYVFEVVNTSTWTRTDLATIRAEDSRIGDRIIDEKGRPVPSQRLSDGRLVFLVRSIPGLGTRRYTLMAGPPANEPGVSIKGFTLQNQSLRISVDPRTGDVREVRDLARREDVVSEREGSFNTIVVVPGTDPHLRTSGSAPRVRIGERGPLVASIISEQDAPGITSVRREVILTQGLDRVDVRNVVDKKRVREKEAVYFGFRVNVPDPTTRLDLGWGVIRPEADQLPGSCKDFFSVQRWVDVSNGRVGATLTTVEAPLVSLGDVVDERRHNDGPDGWKTSTRSSAQIYSWVMNNYWHTNYKADQPGTTLYQYALHPHAAYDAVEAYRAGIEANQPLVVRHVPPAAPRSGLPFAIKSRSVTATTIVPREKGYLVRLYNPSPLQSSVEIVGTTERRMSIARRSVTGATGPRLTRPIDLGPFEIMTVVIE